MAKKKPWNLPKQIESCILRLAALKMQLADAIASPFVMPTIDIERSLKRVENSLAMMRRTRFAHFELVQKSDRSKGGYLSLAIAPHHENSTCVWVGAAWCHSADQFDRSEGRRRALARLRHAPILAVAYVVVDGKSKLDIERVMNALRIAGVPRWAGGAQLRRPG